MRSFEHVRGHLAAAGFRLTLQEPYVTCVELSLQGGTRHQSIFVGELEGEDGRPLLRVSSPVGPAAGVDPLRALAFNWHSRTGYLAVADLDGEPYLQLCENRPYECLTPAELERLVLEIGGLGDRMERELSADGDML